MRKVPTDGTSFFIPAIREGDTGVALEMATTIGSGDILTVYSPVTPYSYFSRVDGTIFYKRYDVPWTDGSLTIYPQPVVNMGDHLHFRVNPGGTATWSMSGTTSYSWIGGTVDYLWFPPTGISLVAPSVDTDATVNLEGTAGRYRMRLRGRDNNQSPDNSYRYVFITDGVNVKAFNELFDVVAIDEEPQTRTGRVMTITVKATRGTDVLSYLYKGAPVVMTVDHQYSSNGWRTATAAPSGVIDNFFGYIRRWERISTTPDGIDTYSVRVESPLIYFGDLPVASQTIIAAAAPENWAEVLPSLAHVAYFAYYLLQYHGGALLSLSDYFRTDLGSFFRPALSSGAGDMLNAAIKAVGLVTGANIGCTSNGAIWLKRHASYESDAWRNANGTAWTWTGDDIVGDLDYSRDPIMVASETEGVFSISGTAIPITTYTARAGIFAGMQGVAKEQMDAAIALSTTDAGLRVGHQHQRTNAPTQEVEFTIRGGLDIIEPALMEWFPFDLAQYDPGSDINYGLLSHRALPISVSRTWTFAPTGVQLALEASFEPETKGKEAPERPVDVIGSGFSPTYPACPSFSITWASEGATPSGFSGLSGQEPFSPNPPYGQVNFSSNSRGANQNWIQNGSNTVLGVMYEFSGYCTVSHMEMTVTTPGAGNTTGVVFWGLTTSGWQVIDSDFVAAASPYTHSWTGSIVVSAVIFSAAHGSAGANAVSMTVSKINSP